LYQKKLNKPIDKEEVSMMPYEPSSTANIANTNNTFTNYQLEKI
jgi:hypothetical protein